MSSNSLSLNKPVIISNIEVSVSEYRLDPNHYNEDAHKVISHLKKAKFNSTSIGDLDEITDIIIPNRFSRNYVTDIKFGVPFLGSSTILMINLPKKQMLSKKHTKEIDELMLEPGVLIISRSGTVGVSLICGDSYSGFSASEHCIRVYASKNFRGYLHTVLSSPIGQIQLLKESHGKVVKEITEDQIKNIIIPKVSNEKIKKINKLTLDAITKYDESRKILLNADAFLINELNRIGIKPISEKNDSKSFITSSNALLRIDPHSYTPSIFQLRKDIEKVPHNLLGKIADVWGVARFKRYYTNRENGTPFFSSTDIMRVKLEASKYISSTHNLKNITQCKVEKDTLLIPCSGTYGGILGCCVKTRQKMIENPITQHAIRVKVNHSEFYGDFVAAFLNSKKFGYPLITSIRFGKDVPELDIKELKRIPIPKLSKNVQKTISDMYSKSYLLLDDANILEEIAQKELLDALEWKE